MIEYFNSSRYKSSKERLEKAFNFEIDDFSEAPLILQTIYKFNYYFRHSFKK